MNDKLTEVIEDMRFYAEDCSPNAPAPSQDKIAEWAEAIEAEVLKRDWADR
jgi:hypothetical protein